MLISCPLLQHYTLDARGERLDNDERTEPGITLDFW
jgi:hypothetical protein